MESFYGTVLTIRSKVEMMQQNHNVTEGINYGADAKRVTHRRLKKLTPCQFLHGAKNALCQKF